MNKTKNKFLLYLLALFLGIFIIKVIVSFMMYGTFVYVDEFCVLQKAYYFIHNFELRSCTDIIGRITSNQSPLYSILISPIYLFFSGFDAYYAILILNSLLVSSLVFPIYKILKQFLKKEWLIYIFITITLFSASIFTLEKTVMTDTLFLVIGVWFLYFYFYSFIKNKKRNKIISIILAILAVLTRPYGFILPLALLINEFVLTKNKKNILLLSTFFFVIALTFIIVYKDIFFLFYIYTKISSLLTFDGLYLFIISLKNQLNSIILPLFFLIPIIFVYFNFNKDLEKYNKIKFFILSFIILNFLIGLQHIFGYYLGVATDNNPTSLNFLTRYLNLSITYILLFSFIFLYNYKKIEINNSRFVIISTALFIPILFVQYINIKYSQSFDIEFYNYFASALGTIALFIFLFTILIINNKHLTSIIIAILLIFNSFFSFQRLYLASNNSNKMIIFDYFFENSNFNILVENQFYINKTLPDLTYPSIFWSLKLLSDHNVDMVYDLDKVQNIENYDYIIVPNDDSQNTALYQSHNHLFYTNFENVFEKID